MMPYIDVGLRMVATAAFLAILVVASVVYAVVICVS